LPYKYKINPLAESGDDTICQNLRYLHRRATKAGDAESVRLTEKCFDFAKRMNAKLQYYKNKYEPGTGPAIKRGHPEEDD
jgi:hypothetical protein